MSALFNSLIRAIGGVAVSVVVVALVWTIYINREAVADIAAPVVSPLIDSAAANNTVAAEPTR
ncbi:MAG: cellobiose-specific phosphotransferase system component IIC [Gammaproteobacteria bacterium]|jgi:cellobiose-specific phosphotransferase system component IIC